jgi:hypothetical protein
MDFHLCNQLLPIAARTQNNTTEKLTIADQPYNAIGDIFVKLH